jgi:hypothetical protein
MSARNVSLWIAAGVLFFFAGSASAGMTTCELRYSVKGWSFFYKEIKGYGTVTCANGQSAKVAIEMKGGGVTAGKSEIDDGTGTFSEVKDISEIFGTYVSVEGHAGVTKSAEGRVMTKGEVSLALSGDGRGFDLGFAFGGFTITRK